MLRHKSIDRLCCVVLAATILLTCAFMGAAASGLIEADSPLGYEERLFDQSYVHTVDIVMDGWERFLDTCTNEEYAACTVVIDGENVGSAAIRAKGNTSLSQVPSYGNDRYSFKIEFDHYETGKTYHGLDKLSLNNLIQDKTLMKDYLAYTLMGRTGAAAPLCSFVQVNVNGQPWGVYLAVEAVEDSFLTRNYGADHGDLYKPDSMSMGGGRGNGRDFDMDEFSEQFAGMQEAEGEGGFSFGGKTGRGGFAMGGGRDFMSGLSLSGGIFNESFDWTAVFGESFDFGSLMRGAFRLSDYVDADFDVSQLFSEEFDPAGYFGEDFEYSDMLEDDFDWTPLAEALMGGMKGGFGAARTTGGMGGGMGSSDVMLQYSDDDPSSYQNIFDSAKTDVTGADQARLIESLRKLSEGETIDEKLEAVDAEAVIRYLVVHSFMDNGDSYTGSMIHNYYLYEEDGRLSMLPWDYNLAFGSFSMGRGMSSGSGATASVNSPIDSPVTSGDISTRPILSWIFESEEYTGLYHDIYREFAADVFESGWLTEEIRRVSGMLAPYVKADENGFTAYEDFLTAAETLEEYCRLRGESIIGQLNGTVPSTSAAQNAEPGALIDASHVDLNDMGGMGGFEMPASEFELPEGFTFPGGMDGAAGITPPAGMTGMTPPGGMGTGGFPGGAGMMNGMMQPPGEAEATAQANSSGSAEPPQETELQPEATAAPEATGGGMGGTTGMTPPGGMGTGGFQGGAGMMNGMMQPPGGSTEPPQQETLPQPETTAAPAATEETGEAGEAAQAVRPAQMAGADMRMREAFGSLPGAGGTNAGMETWILLGACAAVLLAALFFAKFHRSGR